MIEDIKECEDTENFKSQGTVSGYCVLTNTISGYDLVWRGSKGEEIMPQIFVSEKKAQEGIIDDLEDEIDEWKRDERDWDEINWPHEEHAIARIEISPDGKLEVWEDGMSGEMRHVIIETTLQEWRDNL